MGSKYAVNAETGLTAHGHGRTSIWTWTTIGRNHAIGR